MHRVDVDGVINTFARLYGQDPMQVKERIKRNGLMSKLIQNLNEIYDQYPEEIGDLEVWVADALGLSNTLVPGPIPNGTPPINNLTAHGGTLHYGNAGGLVCVRCQHCSTDFLVRAGLLKPASQIIGAVAYRVPGLKYDWTTESGTGIIVKNKKVVGRFLWAIPTCDCDKLEDATVEIPDVAMPKSNEFVYGSMNVTQGEWLPFNMQTRIKW
jgi:hypothetical protein